MKPILIVVYLLGMVTLAQAQTAAPGIRTPDIGVNALILYRNSNFSEEDESLVRNGVSLHEAEFSFISDVDPYSRLVLYLGMHPEAELNEDGEVEQEMHLELEEAFADISALAPLGLKVGKFNAQFGKHNTFHTHSYPLLEAPLVNTTLLGEHGMNDVGLSLVGSIPANWFSELTLQYLRGEGELEYFNSKSPNDGVGVAHFKNLFDLSEDATVEVGLSHAMGSNSMGGNTNLSGLDVTYKWRPSDGGKFRALVLGGELIQRNLEQPDAENDEKGLGWNIFTQYQFAQSWRVTLRYDEVEVQDSDDVTNPFALENIKTTSYSGGLRYNPSEFSSYQIEYNQVHGPQNVDGEDTEHRVLLIGNFTIGSHPAHTY